MSKIAQKSSDDKNIGDLDKKNGISHQTLDINEF